MDWIPTAKQQFALSRTEDEILFGGARGGGKDIHAEALVLTSSGWKKAKEITYRDSLVSVDGEYTKILGIFPKKDRKMYKITFIDGRNVVCDADHSWSLYSKNHGHRDGWMTKKTKDILNNPTEWSIPLAQNTPGKKWDGVDPYILGYILGNGTLVSDREIIYTVDQEVIDYLRDKGWSIHDYPYMNTIMCNPVDDAHEYQNILGKVSGGDKNVPEELLYSDYNTRLSLLQGLMDSDGHCDKEGRATFTNKSIKLCEAVQYLTRSLGGKSVIRQINRGERYIRGYKTDGKYFKVTVSYVGRFKPFKLSRKAERLRMNQKGDKLGIKSIEKVENGDGVCFEVEHPSHLFVIEGFIVTHNTDAGMAFPLYYIDNPKFRFLVIRRNADDLRDWVDRARVFYSRNGGVITGNPPEITFPSGAKGRTGHLKDDSAYTKYQGHEYQIIIIEELTHIPREEDYEKLLGSLRSTIGIAPQVFCTTNPDGVGFEWVKERFRTDDKSMKPKQYRLPNGEYRTRIFIPSRIEDNPHLLQDSNYINYLDSISDDVLRRQWREGSWEEPRIKGSYYGDQYIKALDEGRITRVPHEEGLQVSTYWDLGVGDATAIWFVQQVNNEVRFIDYYENEGEGLPHYIQVLQSKPYIYSRHVAPHDIEVRELTSGKSRKEIAQKLGIRFDVAPKLSFDDGINAGRMLFSKCWFDEAKCKQGLLCLKKYRKEYDEKRSVFKDKPIHDCFSHGADAFRYCAISIRQPRKQTMQKKPFNPWDIV